MRQEASLFHILELSLMNTLVHTKEYHSELKNSA